ncbi:hypothetical protein [Longimicrobium sp.]|uniref:hypothetical protein n=1 Tax=Longimicrobium sp. TaxID=2029185 RepID=UPI002C121D68|nr:hypothetical protein [Longimicrobium sp.]HSU17656.1 hypothetical protein [Longimicrobium sp.]
MKKLQLDLDQLHVEGFVTDAPLDERGTVEGAQTIIEGTCGPSCLPSGCTFHCTTDC